MLALAPEPSGALPIIGHLHKLGGQNPIARTFAALADQYGPIFTIRFGTKSAVVISNHEAVKECFTTNDKALAGPVVVQGLAKESNLATTMQHLGSSTMANSGSR